MSKRRQLVMSVPLLGLFWTQSRRVWAQPSAEPDAHETARAAHRLEGSSLAGDPATRAARATSAASSSR